MPKKVLMTMIGVCLSMICACSPKNKDVSNPATSSPVAAENEVEAPAGKNPSSKVNRQAAKGVIVKIESIEVFATSKKRPLEKDDEIILKLHTNSPYEFPKSSRIGIYFDVILKYAYYAGGDGFGDNPAEFTYKIEEAVLAPKGLKLDSKLDFRVDTSKIKDFIFTLPLDQKALNDALTELTVDASPVAANSK